jgi:DNA-binding transcriptional LysR family regulator
VLDLRRLQTFAAVVDTGSVTAAARRLEYTPSSVSQQVSALERDTGVALFEKYGRGIRPTEAGRLLAEHAAIVLRTVDDAETALADLRAGRKGRVRVMSFASAGDTLVPPAVAHLRQTRPGLVVKTLIGEADDAYQMLRSHQVELAVVLEPFGQGEEPDDDLVRVHLLDDPYRAMLPLEHPLAASRTVELTDLASDDWVAAVGGNGFAYDDTLELCRRAGFAPKFVAHAVEFPAAQAYVAAGIGVGLVPELALATRRPDVAVRRLRREPEPRHIWLVSRPSVVTTPAVAATVEALRRSAREHQRRSAQARHPSRKS